MAFLISVCLISCSFGTGTPPEGGDGEEIENLICDTKTTLYLVYDPEQIEEEDINLIVNKFSYRDVYVETRGLTGEPQEHELVLGNVGRPVSDSAYAQLERIDLNTENDLRYVIYSSGSSIAIAYDENPENYVFDMAIDYFIDNIVSDQVIAKRGVIHKYSFDLYEYLGELDAEYYQKSWNKIASLAGVYGSDLVNAIQSFYSLFDGEKLVKWMANLYDSDICVCQDFYGEAVCRRITDPENASLICGTGGFYYSNSARDNYGFLPDAESTVQALGFLGRCGIAAGIGGDYVSLIPDWMAEQIIAFTYNLQDPDGFFYHPQWGKDIGNSRRSRDYNWCLNMLKAWGVKTKYKTMGDIAVETSFGLLTERLGSSTVAAASKVIAVESETRIPDHLKTLEAFKQYVYDQDVYNNSYSAGNNFSSQMSQIKTRPKEYCDFLRDHLNEVYNFYGNGTWHHTINYYAINGVMKISGVYSSLKAEIPDAHLACRAAFAAVSSDQETSGIVDIWNTWEAVVRILGNISSYAEGGEETVKALREEILSSAASAIIATRDKVSEFVKIDGSISYKKKNSSPTSQGVPVAVSGTNEGDVNATVIGSLYNISSIFSSLGMSEYEVTMCRSKERAIFYDIIENLSPINKGGDGNISYAPIDFDYEDVNDVSAEVTLGSGSDGIVVEDPRGSGNVLHYVSAVYPGSENKYNDNSLKLVNQGVTAGASAQVFEGELCFLEAIPTADAFRIELGSEGDASNCYRITFRQSGDDIQLWEGSSSSSTNNVINYLGVSAKVGEWFKLKVEYYKGDDSSVRIKIYFNDKLCAVSDNYYNNNGTKLTGTGTPNSTFKHTRFYALNGKRVSVLMDNIASYGSRDAYIREELHEDYASNPFAINVDKIYESSLVYDMEDAEGQNDYPDRLTVNKVGTAAITESGENKSLALSGGSSVYVPVTKLSRDANCSVFGFTVSAANVTSGDFATVSIGEANSTNLGIVKLTLSVVVEDGTRYVVMKDKNGKTLSGVKFSADETADIRVDYYETEKVTIVYVNGNASGITSVREDDAKRIKFAKAIFNTIGSAEIIVDNIYAERSAKDYNEATTPKYESKVYGFENGTDGLTVVGASVSSAAGNAYLRVEGSSSKLASVKIPVNNRDDVVTLTTLSFDISFINAKKNGVTHQISINAEGGESIISFAVAVDNGSVKIYEKTALGMHKQFIANFDTSASVRLTFEYYEVERMCKVFINGEYVTVTALVYSKENAMLDPAYATVATGATSSTVSLDNLCLDRVNRLYSPGPATYPESDAPVVTFDSASGNNYSNKIVPTINSAASAPSVVEVNKNGEADKALKFETLSGSSMDLVTVNTTTSGTGAVSHVFETDFMIESGSGTLYQIWFMSGTKSGMQLNVHISGNKVYFYHGNTNHVKYDTGVAVGQWMTLRAESYLVDGKLIGKIYINGEHAYTVEYYSNDGKLMADTYVNGALVSSAIATNNETVVGGVSRVEFRALKAAVGVCYLDNVSLGGSAESYKK